MKPVRLTHTASMSWPLVRYNTVYKLEEISVIGTIIQVQTTLKKKQRSKWERAIEPNVRIEYIYEGVRLRSVLRTTRVRA